jgi:hypothetical protein
VAQGGADRVGELEPGQRRRADTIPRRANPRARLAGVQNLRPLLGTGATPVVREHRKPGAADPIVRVGGRPEVEELHGRAPPLGVVPRSHQAPCGVVAEQENVQHLAGNEQCHRRRRALAMIAVEEETPGPYPLTGAGRSVRGRVLPHRVGTRVHAEVGFGQVQAGGVAAQFPRCRTKGPE